MLGSLLLGVAAHAAVPSFLSGQMQELRGLREALEALPLDAGSSLSLERQDAEPIESSIASMQSALYKMTDLKQFPFHSQPHQQVMSFMVKSWMQSNENKLRRAHIKEYRRKNAGAEPPQDERKWSFEHPVLLSGSMKTFREIAIAAAAGHDSGYPEAVKAQHDYFTGLPAGNNLLDLRDYASMPGGSMNPLGVGTRMGAGTGTGGPIMHEIHSIAAVLAKLNEFDGWDIPAKQAVAYLIAKTAPADKQKTVFEEGLSKADVDFSDADYAGFEAEEHMKLLVPLIRAAEYAHVGYEHQEEQGGYLCGAMAIFIEYHVYGGVCANIDCPEDDAEDGDGSKGLSVKNDFIKFVGLQSQWLASVNSQVGTKGDSMIAFSVLNPSDPQKKAQWNTQGPPVLEKLVTESFPDTDSFCDIVARLKKITSSKSKIDARDCAAEHDGIQALCGIEPVGDEATLGDME